MQTVSILYGFGEGPRVGRRFHRALRAKGYTVVDNASKADIIFTHSGGCLLLPAKLCAAQIIHIAPYHWPGRSWLRCIGRKLLDDLRTHHREGELKFWGRKTLWNFIYACNMPKNLQMIGNLAREHRWQCETKTIVVRPRFDSFCIPDSKALPFRPGAAFVSLPGHHDDCWRNPDPYIALIQPLKEGKPKKGFPSFASPSAQDSSLPENIVFDE